MAWASASTQNWHCRDTTFSPVIGIWGVAEVPVADGVTGGKIVAVGIKVCPPGGTVHTGVGSRLNTAPQAEFKNITVNAPIRI
jgi:hypothetical protein